MKFVVAHSPDIVLSLAAGVVDLFKWTKGPCGMLISHVHKRNPARRRSGERFTVAGETIRI
ncbi:MAG: hypothetical protein QXZ09_06335 [Candidatus Methanomethylicaceae archaeon]